MAYIMCPHFNESSKTCKAYGDNRSIPDDTRRTKCLSKEDWLKCLNYKATKK